MCKNIILITLVGAVLLYFRELGEDMGSLIKLKYGDDCSWEEELERQDFVKMLYTEIPTDYWDVLYRSFAGRGYNLCSAPELFVCDEASRKCVCGDPVDESLFEVDRSLYTLEEGNKCHWNTNANCIPEDVQQDEGLRVLTGFSSCKFGTSCKTTDGEACSAHWFRVKWTESGTANQGWRQQRKDFFQMLHSGNICSCQ